MVCAVLQWLVGHTDTAIETYKYIIQQWPTSDQAMESQAKIAITYIESEDNPNAAIAVDKLIKEHNHQANLFV